MRSWTIDEAFRIQAAACHRMGSELYGRLLDAAIEDLAAGGAVAAVIEGWEEGDPLRLALPLRLTGTVHRLVLSGRAPDLARHYPSMGGSPEFPECIAAFMAVLDQNHEEARRGLEDPVQTNEVGRSAVLIGGFHEIAGRTGLPLAIHEIGAAGGLNLFADRYTYRLGDSTWGDPGTGVMIGSDWRGEPPAFTELAIVTRRGCDPAPLDFADPVDRIRGLSYIWPDQLDRIERTRRAMELVAAAKPAIIKRRAADWLETEALTPRAGVATVVFHSVVWQYLDGEERARIASAIETAGVRAQPEAPFAWLRFEPVDWTFEIRLRLWPGGVDELLGTAHPHGSWVEWSGG